MLLVACVNVAGLLANEVGAERSFEVHDASVDLPDDLTLAQPIAGWCTGLTARRVPRST